MFSNSIRETRKLNMLTTKYIQSGKRRMGEPSCKKINITYPEVVPYPEVSEGKIQDVKGLLKYLRETDQIWIKQLLGEQNI